MGINLMVLSQIERVIKCFPKIFKFNTRTTVILNGLDCREFSLLDLIHELLWTILLVGNFINFSIKKVIFHPPNHLFEFFLVFQLFWLSVHIEVPLTIIIPPGFGVLHDINFLRMFIPVRYSSHWGGSLQNELGDEWTCRMTLASAYVLHYLSTTWSQL